MTWTTRPRSDASGLPAIRAGTGARVVLLHGVGLRAEAWGAQIDDLSRDYAVDAYDMPGHGTAARFNQPPHLRAYTDRLAGGLTGCAVVVGHSMGAMIALDLAVRYPELVRGVVAMNAIYQRTPQAAEAVRRRAGELDGKTVADPAAPIARWFGGADTSEATACRTWLQEVDPAGYRDAYTVFARADGPDPADLRNLHVPALFLTGADDPNSTPAMSDAMARATPNAHADSVTGAAHMLPMTHAAHVNRRLRAFIASCPAKGA
ncbi:alpha/beta hydrolase [uncultured Tateyamaria sp.]|uniref:alpha/beta fold hydrolase n=1 Tax=Tateyamaria sp. 1078 TaxID=3417464 RepID=UPI002629C463|nr:alpha/beta hydrolase [uncultured Tateyamaria sp.]